MPSITKQRADALSALEEQYSAQGAQLVAVIANQRSIVAQQALDIRALEARLDEAQSEARLAAATHADAKRIVDRAALMRRAKQLAAEGVPCTMRGDFILHAQTKAILAQVAK